MKLFKEYYKKFKPTIKAIEEREFGFGDEKKIDYRHYTFKSGEELRAFLEIKTPKYASYSCAYYEAPEAKPVEAKGYKKSELIFDIDKKYAYENNQHELDEETVYHTDYYCEYCIKKNALEFVKLTEDFLEKDFGFSEKDITINYSGSKGFHCHVENEIVEQIGSNARRKIVEYINGSDIEAIIDSENKIQGTNYWKKQFTNKLFECLSNEEICKKILGKKTCTEDERKGIKEIFEKNQGKIRDDEIKQKIIDAIKENGIEVDSQVTIDKSRLIRIPDSIHGDTGLIAKTIPINELESFNSGKQAKILDGEVSINMIENTSITFAQENYKLDEGKTYDVPKSLGLLLYLTKKANVEWVENNG